MSDELDLDRDFEQGRAESQETLRTFEMQLRLVRDQIKHSSPGELERLEVLRLYLEFGASAYRLGIARRDSVLLAFARHVLAEAGSNPNAH